MSFFDWITKKFQKPKTPWIDQDDFVENIENNTGTHEETTKNTNNMSESTTTNEIPDQNISVEGKELINEFLSRDFEPQGYQDALVNSDTAYANSNKEILKYQLEIIIEKALTYYNNKIKDYDFHISTRKENGMMDTVAEVETEKSKCTEEIEKIKTILAEAKDNKGVGHIVVLSYERGFKRGLAAITAAKIFGKNISNE